jgi:hypothetical protein
MIRRPIGITIIALSLCLAASARSATYRWTDDAGVKHFTDNPDTIPNRYLSRTTELPSMSRDTGNAPAVGTEPSPPAQQPAAKSSSSPPEKKEGSAANAESAKLAGELKKLEEGLPAKKEELARLRRKWVVVKGRTPTAKELEAFEKKRVEGEAAIEDNPFVNKSPLSSPGRYRVAYYRKLEEIRRDEMRIEQLRNEIKALQR